MKKSVSHLPKHKRDELRLIVEKIRERIEPQMLILFGSYARNQWVEACPDSSGLTPTVNEDYKITKKQLEYLAKRVKLLQRLTKKICKEKIEMFI